MYFQEPFIFTRPSATHIYKQSGYHAIFAVRIPFIPSFLTSDFTRSLLGGGKSRLELITERQVRFINDLLHIRSIGEGTAGRDTATIELRFITKPANSTNQQNSVDIVFLGKVFHLVESQAKEYCLQLWHKFAAHFPFEDPFNYPLQPINETQIKQFLNPLALSSLKHHQILEIRKYEDFDPNLAEGSAIGYFPHRFMPTFDASALGRFLETLMQQKQICVASICLRPTKLTKEEENFLMRKLSEDSKRLELETAKSEIGGRWKKLHFEQRFEDIHDTFWPIINRRFHLFEIKIQVLGERQSPINVLEALGSELLGNTYKIEPRIWSCEQPITSTELEIAKHNFEFLEYIQWGKQRVSDPSAARLRYLVTPTEAAGAFRLPIPPESGYLPGLLIRDEPFVLPQSSISNLGDSVSLGKIIHHGQVTGEEFTIPIRDITRHGLIAGTTGSGKTNTCLHLLSQLWANHNVPFLVMYPIDKPDYRLLMADSDVKEKLLIYTVGDETTSPFRFNPFHIADNILLKTHISLLMRCFSAAFSMWDPLPAVYRASLRQVYQSCGWNLSFDTGKAGRSRNASTPTMAQFYEVLVTVADDMTSGFDEEAKGRVKQSAEIRLRDLLLNAGSIVNVNQPAPMDKILQHPTVMELGRVGSPQDVALIMGFLVVQLVGELQSSHKDLSFDKRKQPIRHITLIEEAHRLMSAGHGGSEDLANPQAKGGEDFANILAEVRGFGEGILIAEQIPTQLVNGAIGNTNLKIMHRLEDQDSFRMFGDILNLNERQKEYVRSLGQGSTIVRGRDSRPVFVKVGNYLDRFQTSEDYPIIDDSDESLQAFMADKSVTIPNAELWEPKQSRNQPTILLNEDSETFLQVIQEAMSAGQHDKVKKQVSNWLNPSNLQKIKQLLCEDVIKKLGYSGEEAEIILDMFP